MTFGDPDLSHFSVMLDDPARQLTRIILMAMPRCRAERFPIGGRPSKIAGGFVLLRCEDNEQAHSQSTWREEVLL